MRDWIAKLDDFLRVSEREILTRAGKVSHDTAIEKARAEFEKFRRLHADDPSPVERYFVEAVRELKQLEEIKKPRNTRKPRKGKNNKK